jgi:hypothetical protein
MGSHRRTSVRRILFAGVAVLFWQPHPSFAQLSFVPHDVHNAPPDGSFTYPSSPSCSLADGGYVPAASSLRVDTVVTWGPSAFYGLCDWYISGQYYFTGTRNLNVVRAQEGDAYQNFSVDLGAQSYDSAAQGRSLSWYTGTVGAHTLTLTTWGMPTECAIPMYDSSSVRTMTFNTVACEPKWIRVGNPLVTEHLPVTSVSLHIPTGTLWDTLVGPNNDKAAVSAVNDWNAALSDTGVSISITDQTCGSGGDCIELSSSTGLPSNACARFDPTSINLSTGAIQATSNLLLNQTYWPSASQDRLKRTIAHELGHGLSLDHNTCAIADSLMSIGSSCTDATGMTTSPAQTDVLPSVTSTYGNQVRSVCGF